MAKKGIDGTTFNLIGFKFKRGTKAQLVSSTYVPILGEIVVATDDPALKIGDGTKTLAELDFISGGGSVEDSYNSTSKTSGLSAAKGKDLNDRLSAWEHIETIDCGELPVEETEDPEQQSGE